MASYKLDHTRDLFPEFTDHTIRHSDSVVEILDRLVPDGIKEGLSAWELYFLVAATYLHDIGLVEGCPRKPTRDDYEEYLVSHPEAAEDRQLEDSLELRAQRDYVRDHHHERSEEYIRQNWRELELRASDTPHEGHIVGRIALGHRKVDLGDRVDFGEVAFGNNQLVRRDLLAAYLRLADELDTTAFRTPWAEYEVLNIYDETSQLEWGKHLSIGGYVVTQGTIRITGACYDHAMFLRLLRLEKELGEKLAEIKSQLQKPYASGDGFYVEDPMPFHSVEVDIEHVGYLPIDIKFELEHEQIIKLIMGERLYGDPTACIRELLQNAVDTCREAREQRPKEWTPEIRVSLDEDANTLSVSDNGMGMDEDIVRRYFARVGLSYYRSGDFKGSFRPISEFGIGVLSCFMVADEIEVESKRDGTDPIHLRIRNLTESFVPSKGTQTEPGTTVCLHLKPGLPPDHEGIARVVRYHARHVQFPIIVTDGDKSTEIMDEGLVPLREDIRRYTKVFGKPDAAPAADRGDNAAVAERQRGGIALGVTLLSDLVSKRAVSTTDVTGVLSQHGFRVTEIKPEDLRMAALAWCEINVTGNDTLPLTADRSRIAHSPDEFWTQIGDLYSEAVEALSETSGRVKSDNDWWEFHEAHYGNYSRYDIPATLRRAWEDNAVYCTLTREGFLPRRPSDVEQWEGRVYWAPSSSHREFQRIREVIPEDAMLLMPHRSYGSLSLSRDREASPKLSLGIDNAYWAYDLAKELSEPLGYHELLESSGITWRGLEIDGSWIYLFDAGHYLGRWKFGTVVGIRTCGPLFDFNHPFSKIIAQWCNGPLPRTSLLSLRDLLGLDHGPRDWDRDERTSGEEIHTRQLDVLHVLQRDRIIPTDIRLEQAGDWDVPGHDCPYAEQSGKT